MLKIEGKNFPNERDLYGAENVVLKNCTFDGEADGESALKEARNIRATDCYFNLRYPLWHDKTVDLERVEMTDKCRAALWYSEGVTIKNSQMNGIKAVRECKDVSIENSKIVSPEFGWKCRGLTLKDCTAVSEYFMLLSKDVWLERVDFTGKYSFQYVENLTVENCTLTTKDAFWHAKNVTVKNSVVNGEYLGWYSENLTLDTCKILGTQPLCYCKNLKLINCEMQNTDLAFEYSEVCADINSDILSVKNPLTGKITAKSIGEIIITKDSKYPCDCTISETDAR